MTQRTFWIQALGSFLIAFAISFLANLFVRFLSLGLSDTAEWLLLGLVFATSFLLARLLLGRRHFIQ